MNFEKFDTLDHADYLMGNRFNRKQAKAIIKVLSKTDQEIYSKNEVDKMLAEVVTNVFKEHDQKFNRFSDRLHADLMNFKSEIKADIASFKTDIASFKTDVNTRLETGFANSKSTVRWKIGTIISTASAVVAIVGLITSLIFHFV